jgi:hypothetical protein
LAFSRQITDFGATPHPTRSAGHLLPQGEKDFGRFAKNQYLTAR